MTKEIYDKLVRFKAQSAYPTLEAALESLLQDSLKEISFKEKHTA